MGTIESDICATVRWMIIVVEIIGLMRHGYTAGIAQAKQTLRRINKRRGARGSAVIQRTVIFKNAVAFLGVTSAFTCGFYFVWVGIDDMAQT